MSILKNRDFMCLWVSQWFSQAAERLFLYVLILLTYVQTHSSFSTVIPALGFGLPAILFGSKVGVYVDRHPKKTILIRVNIMRALLILAILYVLPMFSRSLWAIFTSACLVSVLSQFFMPSETTLIARVVTDKTDLLKANTLFISTFFAVGVLVFTMASYTAEWMGQQGFLLMATVFFMLSAWVVSLIRYQEAPYLPQFDWDEWWEQYLQGIKFAWQERQVRLALLGHLFVTTIFSAVTVMGVSFVDKVLGWAPEKFGYLAMVGGVGMGFGMIFVNHLYLEYRLAKIVSWGFAVAGAGLVFFAIGPFTIVHFFGLLFSGFGSAFVFVPIQTILQTRTPQAMQARVLAIQNMILNFSLTLPILVLGKLADQYGIFRVFLGLGIMSIFIYIAYRISTLPRERHAAA